VQQLDLTEVQASAILDMQLRRLAALEREKLEEEYRDLQKRIAELEALLADPSKVLALVKEDTQRLKKRFGDQRRTEIREEEVTAFSMEEYVLHQDVVVTLSRRGYIKRIPMTTYKLQHRGGKGVRGMTTRDDDVVQDLVVADTHDTLLLFTNQGRVFHLRSFDIAADTSRTSRGTPVVNLVRVAESERVNAIVAVPKLVGDDALVMGTRQGEVKRIRLRDLANIRSPGLRAMDLEPGDELVSARLAREEDDVMMVTRGGQGVRFALTDVRRRSRAAGGVRGIRLAEGDIVVSMEVVQPEDALLVVSSMGKGKLVHMTRFRRQGRGGMGTRAFKTTGKSGPVAAARVVDVGLDDEVMLVSAKGQVERINLGEIRYLSRYATGVQVSSFGSDDEVASIACTPEKSRDGESNGTARPEQGNGRNGSPKNGGGGDK
jgi:DNA gyrase subunit A